PSSMLTRLANAPRPRESTDAVDLLIACHARIRHFTDLAIRLGREGHAAPADQIRAAASALQRYFGIALPLHEADEERSVEPRLRAANAGAEVEAALGAMFEQHARIHDVLDD